MPVFSASSGPITIKAPAENVWQKLCDTSTWPSWNTFVPKADHVDVLDSHTSSDQEVWNIGQRRQFHVKMGGKITLRVMEVTAFETPVAEQEKRAWKICWSAQGYPDFLLKTVRWNEVEETEGGGCVYRTGEDMDGVLAYFVKLLAGRAVASGINTWAKDLKDIAEKEEREKASL
ncbi:hypothetical protein HBI56_172290 [Parastagonospora nodorum]|nr:hypothetical protein HBH53_157090 [Parastagonospora nodorum]KAH3995238.1 hypothetical protein HBI10_176140 [Parastagonospora nodorum]KAH4015530.1 hypothetical protein HBI09_205340 [Parastagonospora nodorum]KAH4017560.1 hypothetical protein HBI13_141670 [Parastagonospora nodorum]KAH4046255.1 hypothetical protein HBH49_187650 [Parastagonospora nodorum]